MKKFIFSVFTMVLFGTFLISSAFAFDEIKGRVLNGKDCVYHLSVHFNRELDYSYSSFKSDITKCLNQGGNINYIDEDGKTPIFALFDGYIHESRPDIDKGLALLLSNSAKVDIYSKESNSILIQIIMKLGTQYYSNRDAEREALKRSINLLINKNINLNHVNNSGNTALFYIGNINNAMSPKYEISIARNLIKHGADPYIKNKANDYFIHNIFKREYLWQMDIKLLNFFFKEINFDINIRGNYGKTMLHYAAEESDLKTIKYLIANGANVKTKDSGNRTPLHLLGRFNVRCDDEPLKIAKLLISNGADVNALDKEGKTPLDWITKIKLIMPDSCEKKGKVNVINYLKSIGGI